MDEIQTLKKQIEEHLKDMNPKTNIYNYIINKTLTSQLERIDKLENLLDINKFKLVFIGEVGTGKTTAICFLFNLVLEDIKHKTIKDKKISTKTIDGLMSIAGGKTTICEVQIPDESGHPFRFKMATVPDENGHHSG